MEPETALQPVADPDILARFNASSGVANLPKDPATGVPVVTIRPTSQNAGAQTPASLQPVADPDVLSRFEAITAQPDTQPQHPGLQFEGESGPVKQFRANEYNSLGSTIGRALDYLLVPQDVTAEAQGSHAAPIESGIRYLGDVDNTPEPQTYAERVGAASGKFLGDNLPMIAGVGGVANSGMRLATDAAPTIGNAARSGVNAILDAIAANPAKSTALEGLASTEAGAGGEIARTNAERTGYGPEGQRLAEEVGQVAMPSIADYMPLMLGLRASGPIYRTARSGLEKAAKTAGEAIPDEYRPGWLDDLAQQGAVERQGAARREVGRQLDTILSDPETAANVEQAKELQGQIPGFSPGIARASGDQNLINTQRHLDTEATGPDLRQRRQAADASAQAIRDYLERGVPLSEGNFPPADTVGRAVQQRVQGDQRALAQQTNAVRNQIQSRSDALPEIDRAATGNTLRDIRGEEQAAANDQVNQLRANIGDPNTPIVVGTRQRLDMARGPQQEPVQMTLQQVLDRQSAINQELRSYYSAPSRTVADTQRMESLQNEKASLNRALDNTDPNLLPGLRAYRDYYRDEYIPRFGEGASRNVGRYDQFGYDKNSVAAENVPAQWFTPNNISGARQFNELYGNNPAARQAMTDYALDDLRHTAVDPNSGLIKQGAVNRWLTKNERVLNEMPWVRDAVAANNPDELYARLGQLEQRQRAIADTKLAGILGKNPEQMIDAGLNDWQTMRSLKRSVQGDPQAEAALTRAVWDRAVKAAGDDTLVNADKLQKFISDNRRSLREVLTPEHLSNLDTVIKAAQIQSRAPRPTGTVSTPLSIPGALGEATGVTVPSAVGSALSVARGRTSPFTEIPMQAVKLWNRQKDRATKAAWNEALSNPDMAEALANVVKTGATPLKVRKLYAYLLTAGALQPSNVKGQ